MLEFIGLILDFFLFENTEHIVSVYCVFVESSGIMSWLFRCCRCCIKPATDRPTLTVPRSTV